MNSRAYRLLLRYGVAIASTAMALLLSLWLEDIITRTIGAFFYIAIAVSTWYGGRKPGMVTIALSTLALKYYFIPPIHQLQFSHLDDVVRVGLFVSVSLIINLLSANLQESKRNIEQLNCQLVDESSDRLKTALSAAQMGMWDWNMVSGEITWSPEHERLLGMPSGSFDGKYETFDACLHPDDREGLNQAIAHSLKNRLPYHHEFRVVWADGSVHWMEGRGKALYGKDGQPVRMSGTIMAIDERKQSQLLLQQQFEQQRLVMEITNRIRQSLNLQKILQITVDEVRQFLQVDRVIIFQFTPDWGGAIAVESVVDEAFALFPFDIHDPCIGDRYVEPFLQGLVTAKSDIYTADISPCHVEFLAQFQVRANLVVPILKNNELWGLLAAHHCTAPRQWQDSEIDLLRQIASQVSIALQQADLFEQVQAELVERRQAETALQERESLLRLFAQYAPAGIAMLDREMRYVMASQRWIDEYELGSVESLIHRSHYDLFPEIPERWRQIHQRCLAGAIEKCDDDLFIRADGKQQWISWEIRPWYTAAGEIGGIVIFSIDVTPRKQAELALQQLNAELEQRVAERTEELNALNSRLLISLKEQEQVKQELEDLYNNAPCGYHSLDAEGTIVRINDTELKWLGYTRDEVLNQMKFTDLITPESQQIFHQDFPQFMRRGWVNDLEFQLRCKDGLTRWVNVNATAIRDDAGNFVMSRSSMFNISDRKQAEKTLALQAVITRNMAEGICLVKAEDATIVYANPKFEQMFGYNSSELNGQPVSILNYNTQDITAVEVTQSIVNTVLQNSEATYEVQNVKKDGTPFWCSATCSVFQHPEFGDVLVAVQQDITERKQTEATLRQKTRQRQLLWSITQTIRHSLNLEEVLKATVTEVKQILEVDRAAVYRFSPDWSGDFIAESVSEEWVKLVSFDVQQVWEDTYLQETQGGRFQQHETFVIPDIYTAGLQPCHIDLLEQFQAKAYAVAPIFAGEDLWGLLAIYQNVSPRNWQDWEIELLQQIASQMAIALQQSDLYNQLQVELQERERTAAVIQEAERRWRSLLDNVQLIVVGLDQSGNINYVNPFFLNLTGYTASDVLGKNWFENFLPPSNQQNVQEVFSEVLSHNAHPYYQNSILTRSGEERFIAWNNTMLQDADGSVIGTISIGEDITERQKIDQMKQEFISVVSHELRTPLTSIRGSLGLIAGGVYDKKPEKMKEMLAIAARQSDRLVRLVNDILNLRRLESGQSKFKFKPYLAEDLIRQSVDVMRSQAEENQITLSIVPTTAEVWADADAIVQTLTNLLSNAIKFSPPHSTVTLTATHSLTASSTPSLTLFSVQDQGRGIPSEYLETIFGQFQQVDASDSREKGGTGLGLAICRTIVKQHGGKIWVESKLEQGSTFYFTLPSTQLLPDNNRG
ncbi:PAS domain S-box protein [Oscillatoria sp. FACHB-1407]|uniref:PAS domain S-box protein n=1 Tax=Oscillatoria sp. FACHB-1407 TaxID=2692847 RepID=UPI001685F141|nr:PAS domain S-box protein [Oscillatoria sp. FACHB-1407]MBD2463462.1 PAS domain S-box protein [Oscillatoria sp. FACHB-1407]